jgi:NADPH-dependent glutamate synthase beta subunit-like oxidoreductase
MMSQLFLNSSNNIQIDRSKCVFCSNCAERCIMDHIRLQLSPCRSACPIGQNCQAYIQQIQRGQSDRALSTLLETNPLAGTLGYICHQPCQQSCARLEVDGEPVAIRALKRFLVENVTFPAPSPIPERYELIGIIGSGPAGLMAAWELRRCGYKVNVYDTDTTPGGNLTRVIPEFRLPKKVAMADIEWIERWGVEFHLGFQVGSGMDFKTFRKQHHALLLATGGGQPTWLNIDGEDSVNVCAALPFLEAVKAGQKPDLGTSVVVIGGGNVAIDAALTAKRLGISSVRVVCLEKKDDMRAFAHSVQEAIEENIGIEYGWGPQSFVRKGNRATSVNCQLCVCVWEDQCFAPTFDCAIGKDFAADSFIVAIGEKPDREYLQSLGLSFKMESTRFADPVTLETNLSGVFAAGDMISGASSVVHAMASGRQAAVSIDRHIKGDDLRYGRSYGGPVINDFNILTANAYPATQQRCKQVPTGERIGMQEIGLALDAAHALEESRRCLNCGVPVGYNDSCWACLPCEVSCPEQALHLTVPFLIR